MSRYCVELCQKFQVSSVHQLTWYHSCNSKAKLAQALRSDVHLIEADVTLGTYEETEGTEDVGFFGGANNKQQGSSTPGGASSSRKKKTSSDVVVGSSVASSSVASVASSSRAAPVRLKRAPEGDAVPDEDPNYNLPLQAAAGAKSSNVLGEDTRRTQSADNLLLAGSGTTTGGMISTAGGGGPHDPNNKFASPMDDADEETPVHDPESSLSPPLAPPLRKLSGEGEGFAPPMLTGDGPSASSTAPAVPQSKAVSAASRRGVSFDPQTRALPPSATTVQPNNINAPLISSSDPALAGLHKPKANKPRPPPGAPPSSAGTRLAVRDDRTVIMAHPPSRRSNLTLEQFVRKICHYNCMVDPTLVQGRRTEVIRGNTTLLEGVEIPNNISFITEDEDRDLRELLEESSSADGNSDTRSQSSSTSGHHGILLMNEELQEHLGMNTVEKRTRRRPKGIKLDFKDLAAVKPAIELLMRMNVWAQVVCVWLNADIAAGPGCLPLMPNWVLDGRKFLQRCCRIPDVVLSLGWISTEFAVTQHYTQRMINDMLELVQRPFLRGKDTFLYTPAAIAHHITFCVQAKYALASQPVLKQLLELVPSSSLTVYTGTMTTGITPDDLQAIEENFDTTRLFVDVYTRADATSKGKKVQSSLGTERCALM
ncbi:unnamed protein product [Amoebophrya sp. A120]|nr:unnamed protein product [Amoebophrya sp. A120]|eukprot:GSA120T00002273001.1